MKIISNFKDYYDFQQGTIGIDDKVVYERINKDYKNPVENEHINGRFIKYKPSGAVEYEVCICGEVHFLTVYKEKAYLNEDYKELPLEIRNKLDIHSSWFEPSYAPLRKTTLNEKYNCPVLLSQFQSYNRHVWENPRLADFNFGRVMDPYTIWVKIYNFLLREPIITNNQTDIEKLEAHGFDKKTSFRKC